MLVLRSKWGRDPEAQLRAILDNLGVTVVGFQEEHLKWFAHAANHYGKGRHPASLNLGDCFSYALAKHMGLPLLFIGNDFSQTDLKVA